jgi:hypothetical protein
MALDFSFPVPDDGGAAAPLMWISYDAFERVTGENLQTPLAEEQAERVRRGLDGLDHDFPGWLEEIASHTNQGIVLRFRDLDAVRNVESKLRDRGLNDR